MRRINNVILRPQNSAGSGQHTQSVIQEESLFAAAQFDTASGSNINSPPNHPTVQANQYTPSAEAVRTLSELISSGKYDDARLVLRNLASHLTPAELSTFTNGIVSGLIISGNCRNAQIALEDLAGYIATEKVSIFRDCIKVSGLISRGEYARATYDLSLNFISYLDAGVGPEFIKNIISGNLRLGEYHDAMLTLRGWGFSRGADDIAMCLTPAEVYTFTENIVFGLIGRREYDRAKDALMLVRDPKERQELKKKIIAKIKLSHLVMFAKKGSLNKNGPPSKVLLELTPQTAGDISKFT